MTQPKGQGGKRSTSGEQWSGKLWTGPERRTDGGKNEFFKPTHGTWICGTGHLLYLSVLHLRKPDKKDP